MKPPRQYLKPPPTLLLFAHVSPFHIPKLKAAAPPFKRYVVNDQRILHVWQEPRVRASSSKNPSTYLNGTESQRTPFSKLRSSYEKYSSLFGVRNPWVPVGVFLDTFFCRKISSILTVVWSKEQIVNLERFGAALLVTSECTLAAGQTSGFGGARSRGHSDEQIFGKIPRVMGWFFLVPGPMKQVLVDGSVVREGKSRKEHAMISDCLLAVGDIT